PPPPTRVYTLSLHDALPISEEGEVWLPLQERGPLELHDGRAEPPFRVGRRERRQRGQPEGLPGFSEATRSAIDVHGRSVNVREELPRPSDARLREKVNANLPPLPAEAAFARFRQALLLQPLERPGNVAS